MIIKYFSDFQKPMSIFLLFSILFIFSCSSDKSITRSTDDQTLNKPVEIFSDDFSYEKFLNTVLGVDPHNTATVCLVVYAYYGTKIPATDAVIPKLHNFRDDFLAKSEKGLVYTACYNLISEYGINNNLVLKYPIEHFKIIESGIELSKELQKGINNNKILVDKSTYDDLINLSKIYRQSENHKDIDPVLDYLETDLKKYYNKPKAEIAADFGF